MSCLKRLPEKVPERCSQSKMKIQQLFSSKPYFFFLCVAKFPPSLEKTVREAENGESRLGREGGCWALCEQLARAALHASALLNTSHSRRPRNVHDPLRPRERGQKGWGGRKKKKKKKKNQSSDTRTGNMMGERKKSPGWWPFFSFILHFVSLAKRQLISRGSLGSLCGDCLATGSESPPPARWFRSIIRLPPIIFALGRQLKWWEPGQCSGFWIISSVLLCQGLYSVTLWLFIRADTLTHSHAIGRAHTHTHTHTKDKNILHLSVPPRCKAFMNSSAV